MNYCKDYQKARFILTERSREAIENFFRKGNITALREMALRIVADRVDKQLHDYMQHKHIRGPWKSGLHFWLRLITGSNQQDYYDGLKTFPIQWGQTSRLLYVETLHKLTPKEHEQLDKNIQACKTIGD